MPILIFSQTIDESSAKFHTLTLSIDPLKNSLLFTASPPILIEPVKFKVGVPEDEIRLPSRYI